MLFTDLRGLLGGLLGTQMSSSMSSFDLWSFRRAFGDPNVITYFVIIKAIIKTNKKLRMALVGPLGGGLGIPQSNWLSFNT